MALNEACQVWIEQRIEEELSERGDTGKSLREIGRELAAEIERVFEAKVNPMTLTNRASRAQRVSNDTPSSNPGPARIEGGNSGNIYPPSGPAMVPAEVSAPPKKLTPQEVVTRVDAIVKKGKSVREATKEVAEGCGRNPGSLRVTYARERNKQDGELANFAINRATVAIEALNQIPKDDKDWRNALIMVLEWIEKQTGERHHGC